MYIVSSRVAARTKRCHTILPSGPWAIIRARVIIATAYDTARVILSIQILFLVIDTHMEIAATSHSARMIILTTYDTSRMILPMRILVLVFRAPMINA